MDTRIPPRSSDMHYRDAMAEGRLDHRNPVSCNFSDMERLFCSPLSEEMEEETERQPDRAVAATLNHREAERRRRERIKLHLDRLRSILACDPKVEKASLLAKAVQHVKDLKRRVLEVGEMDERFPSESDEVSVSETDSQGGRRPYLRASICCEDRSGLFPELCQTLKSLHLNVLRAEISTIGGRVRNVLVVAGEGKGEEVEFLKEALKALAEGSGGMERSKRRRMTRKDHV